MAFQWVFDTAESISVNKRSVVGQTITRNLTVRAVSRGSTVKRITVRLPDGMRWSEVGEYIKLVDAADKFTKVTVTLPNYGSWITEGDLTAGQSFTIICTEFPEWTIFANDQVSWSGPFVFYETTL